MVVAAPCSGRGKSGVGEWSGLCAFRSLKLGWMLSWIVIWVVIRVPIQNPIMSKSRLKKAFFEVLTPL